MIISRLTAGVGSFAMGVFVVPFLVLARYTDPAAFALVPIALVCGAGVLMYYLYRNLGDPAPDAAVTASQ